LITQLMQTKEFEYNLPTELIAQTPIEPRDASRLLVIDRNSRSVTDRVFTDIIDYFTPGDLLILNNTKVIPARLSAMRAGGGKAEIFLLKDLGDGRWEALVNPGSKIPVDSCLTLGKRASAGISITERKSASAEKNMPAGDHITVTVVDKTAAGGRIVRFSSPEQAETALRELGQVPLPPYIKQPITNASRYQTVYASIEGSVAAPTAALHFTPELLDRLKAKGVTIGYTTLHMGLGSFRPIKEELLAAHQMPAEYLFIPKDIAGMVNQAKAAGRRVVACGTDVVRTLESAAQGSGKIKAYQGNTGLFITPGYSFKVVDMVITNLHLPRSSHLVLVSAFAGRELIFHAYAYAVEKKFRFYTFGDATLIL